MRNALRRQGFGSPLDCVSHMGRLSPRAVARAVGDDLGDSFVSCSGGGRRGPASDGAAATAPSPLDPN